jgi:hypothetical protein
MVLAAPALAGLTLRQTADRLLFFFNAVRRRLTYNASNEECPRTRSGQEGDR